MTDSRIKNQNGFTLVEVVLVTVLLGIIGLFSILFVVTGVSGYVSAVENTVLAQKARLAMARITTELAREMTNIASIDPLDGKTYIKYEAGINSDVFRHIRLVDAGARKQILLASGVNPPAQGDDEVLVEGVSDLTLAYKKFHTDGSELNWVVADGIKNLAKIVVTLTLFVSEDSTDTVTFSTTVTPPAYSDLIFTTMAHGPMPPKGSDHVSEC